MQARESVTWRVFRGVILTIAAWDMLTKGRGTVAEEHPMNSVLCECGLFQDTTLKGVANQDTLDLRGTEFCLRMCDGQVLEFRSSDGNLMDGPFHNEEVDRWLATPVTTEVLRREGHNDTKGFDEKYETRIFRPAGQEDDLAEEEKEDHDYEGPHLGL